MRRSVWDSPASVYTSGTVTHLSVLLNQNLHDDILEFDVQHGRHGLHLGSHQRGAEDDGHVGGGHPVVLTVTTHTADTHRAEQLTDSPGNHNP